MNRAHPGRPLDEAITATVLDVTWAQLLERGVGGVSVENVARRAEVAKASIYRRWPSKGMLIAEVATRFGAIEEIPDSGDLRSDLFDYERGLHRTGPEQCATERERAVLAETMLHPDVVPHVRELLLGRRRRAGRAILDRTVERGEIAPDTDVELVLDLLSGALLYRRAFRMAPIETQDISECIDIVLDGIRLGRS